MSYEMEQKFETLMVKATDGALTEEEERELEAFLELNPERREELEDFRRIKETTDRMTERILKDAMIEPPREPPSTRRVLSFGFVSMLAGALVLIGFGAWQWFEMLSDPDVPAAVKIGTGLLGGGALTLLGYTLRVRMRAIGSDPYEEVDL